ncbi:hypothetical protein KHP62_16510 [Rhodobacteraceae bacterium NNCM2]|nr:hypothetical protein [Coraliihabitans acroporae]
MKPVQSLIPLAFCAACLGEPSVANQATIDPSYLTAGGYWNDGTTITVIAKAVPEGGMLAICGAWMVNQSSALSIGYNERVMGTGVIQLDGGNIVNNLLYMNQLAYAPNVEGKTANCTITGTPWEAGMEERISIRLPRQTYGDGVPSGDPRLEFRQGRLPVAFN